jgi:hypothetical protein
MGSADETFLFFADADDEGADDGSSRRLFKGRGDSNDPSEKSRSTCSTEEERLFSLLSFG